MNAKLITTALAVTSALSFTALAGTAQASAPSDTAALAGVTSALHPQVGSPEYRRGLRDGMTDGHKDGAQDARTDCRKRGGHPKTHRSFGPPTDYDNGYTEGYTKGYDSGFDSIRCKFNNHRGDPDRH